MANINLEKQLDIIGEQAVIFIKNLLKTNDKIATGKLYNSIDYVVLEKSGSLILEILAAAEYKYVDDGRKKGAKAPPFTPIVSWLQARHIRFRDKKGRFISNKQAAFIVSKSISKKGIRPLNITQKLIREITVNKAKLLKAGVTQDIQELIDKMFMK